jgi:hypothetical protein
VIRHCRLAFRRHDGAWRALVVPGRESLKLGMEIGSVPLEQIADDPEQQRAFVLKMQRLCEESWSRVGEGPVQWIGPHPPRP